MEQQVNTIADRNEGNYTANRREKTAAAPSKLSPPKRIWEAWKRAGLFIGKVNLYILTFIVYWTVFAITSIVSKVLRKDFLAIRIKKGEKSFWARLHETPNTIEGHQRQF